MIVKFVIGVALIVICVEIGKSKALKLKNSYLYFSSLSIFCKEYESNLAYDKKNLSIFLSKNYTSNYFNKTLNSFICSDENENFQTKTPYLPDFLNEKEKVDVLNFLNSLGYGNTKSQALTVNGYLEIFNELEKEKRELYLKNYSAYLKISFSVGFMLMLMVF